MNQKPTLVIVSDWIRRDLHEPLRHFSQFKIVHLYRQAGYQDMKPADFEGPPAIQWQGAHDLWQKIVAAQPAILQGGEPWASRSSLFITLVTWWYKKTHKKVKLIWPSMENRPIDEKFSGPTSWLVRRWAGVYGRSSNLVMYLNQGAHQNLMNANIPEKKLKKVMWATWGIDCGEFSPQSNSKLKTQNSKLKKEKIILFVGKVSEAKGVPWLLEAFELVHQRLPNGRLVLAGPMGEISNFQFPISKQIPNPNDQNSKRIIYLGIIKNKDLPDLFRRADVVVAPSITTKTWAEQVGMVNLQAMACGVPVITTNSGAIPEFVQDGAGAILVPEQDARAIADVIVKLLTNIKLHSTISKKGRRFVCHYYEVKQNIIKVEELLLNLLFRP